MMISSRQTLYSVLSLILTVTTVFAENGFWKAQESALPSSTSTINKSSNTRIQSINITGSTTVSNVLNILADRFEQNHNNIRINIVGGGSSSAVTAMLANTENIGQMSREMKSKERNAFIKHYGYEPIEFKVAVDALAVYVNKKHPVKQLTSNQLADIFSMKSQHINTWGDLKLSQVNTMDWQKKVIQIYTLPKTSGAYSLFNKKVLKKAGYKVSSISQPTSSAVVQAVGVDSGGITFASSFFKTKRTHFLALEGKDQKFYQPVQPWISSFQYPLSRYLYLYVNKKPGTAISVKNKQFLRFLMANGTQTLIKRAGFYSVSKKIRQQQLELLEK